MKTALFTNFSDKVFEGYWNGKPRVFQPGQSLYMPDYLAKHFAKHLANRELLRIGLERDTSPKLKTRQDGTEFIDNENFNKMFNKAYTPDSEDPIGEEEDPIEVQIAVANKNRRLRDAAIASPVPAADEIGDDSAEGMNGTQVIVPPSDDEDEDDFGGKPVEPGADAQGAGTQGAG